MTRLKLSDFVLGEGEFGVVKRGTYRGLLVTLNFISDYSMMNRMICVETRTQNKF